MLATTGHEQLEPTPDAREGAPAVAGPLGHLSAFGAQAPVPANDPARARDRGHLSGQGAIVRLTVTQRYADITGETPIARPVTVHD